MGWARCPQASNIQPGPSSRPCSVRLGRGQLPPRPSLEALVLSEGGSWLMGWLHSTGRRVMSEQPWVWRWGHISSHGADTRTHRVWRQQTDRNCLPLLH